MKSTPLKWVLWTAIIAVLLLTATSVLVAFILPVYVESKLIPGLTERFGLTPDQVKVRRIGWWGTDLGPIRLSAENVPAISVSAIQVDYSPLSLLQGQIKGIVLGGLGIEMSITSEGVAIAGRLIPTAPPDTSSGPPDLDLKTLLPVKIDRFSIIKSHVVVNFNNRRHHIPFEVKLDTSRLSAGYLKADAASTVAGNSITLAASIDQSTGIARITFDIQDFLLESIPSFVRMPTNLNVAGLLDLGGWGTFALQPLKLNGLSISGQFRNAHLGTPNGTLQNMVPSPGDPQPIHLSINGDSLEKLQWRCEPLRIDSLVNMNVNGLGGDLAYTNGKWSLTSVIKTVIPKQKVLERTDLETDLAMGWQMTAHGGSPVKGIEFDLLSQTDGPLTAVTEQGKLSSRELNINIKGHYRDSTLSTQGKFATGEVVFQMPEGKITTPAINIGGTMTIPAADNALPSKLTARATLPDIRSQMGTTSIHLPKFTVQATGESEPHQPWAFDAQIDLSKGRVMDQAKKLRMSNVSMALPLKWPDAAAAKPGGIKVSTIQWKNHDLGGLKGVLQQTHQGATIRFHHTSKLFPGMRVLLKGRIDTSGARLEAEVPPHHLAEGIDLGRFAPEVAGFRATGQIEAFGRLTADGSGIKASGRFKFNHGRLEDETQGFLLEGIDMEIQMDDLLGIKSAPQQKLRIAKLAMGNLKADLLDVDFQVEDPQTLFVEKAGIHWSKGKINTSSIRVIAGKEDYDVTLFCDRLNLAMVLEQLGAAEGGGDGTVSGRIPVRWTTGRLSFDNGFLYSAPGQTGSIQLTGTQILLSGLPPGSPQHTQLDIATEALKDYIYKWAKLNLITEGETLLLKLQFDGKPNRLMPFAYDQSIGQLKRVAGEGQADFKGINIDLNFRSPLNDIINYKDLFKQEN